MSEANVKFIFECQEMTVQCKTDEKMKDICQKYSVKLGINKNLLLFLYGGEALNFELSFGAQANMIDRENKEMKVLVFKNDNDELICPKCGERIKLNKEKIDEILSGNNEIKDTINGIKLTIENMIKTSSNDLMNFQLKNINKMLIMVIEDFKKVIEKIKNLVSENVSKNEIQKPLTPAHFEENTFQIKFDTKKIDMALDIKKSASFDINHIKFTNIGNKSYKNLYLLKDNINSSKDINFYSNSKSAHEFDLTLNKELKSNDAYNAIVNLNIQNPKPENIYKMVFNIREKGEEKNLSEPFEINIKINRDLEQERKDKANKIYEEIKNDYPQYEQLINKNDIINKLLNNNFNKEEIKNDINKKIEKIKNEKAEKLYNELNLDKINYINKKEIIDTIKEKNFDKKKIQKWIDEKNRAEADKMYNKLSALSDIDFSKSSKNEILNKIIQSNFDEFYIKNLYSIIDEKMVNIIYNELEDEYGISGFIDEESAKDKIRELKLDKNKLNEWIENTLNGEY